MLSSAPRTSFGHRAHHLGTSCASTQMVDIKNRRHFLKKVRPQEDIKPELLFVGSTITVFARQLKLIDYGDEYTRKAIESKSEK